VLFRNVAALNHYLVLFRYDTQHPAGSAFMVASNNLNRIAFLNV
jgi:hypothetical protein